MIAFFGLALLSVFLPALLAQNKFGRDDAAHHLGEVQLLGLLIDVDLLARKPTLAVFA
jgi:hypothetical protein